MFEKEAEEYVRKIRHDVINWGGKEPEERFYNEIKFKQAYLAGAELGYNKAFVEADKNLKAIVTDFNKANERLIKAKELIGELRSSLSVVGECEEEECELLNRAEDFISEVEK